MFDRVQAPYLKRNETLINKKSSINFAWTGLRTSLSFAAIKSQEKDLAMLEKPLKFIRIEIQSHIRKIIHSV